MNLLIFFVFYANGFRLILDSGEQIDQYNISLTDQAKYEIILSNLSDQYQDKLYQISEWTMNMKDGQQISMLQDPKPSIDFDNMNSMRIDVQLKTGWQGNLTVFVSGYKQIDGSQTFVQKNYSTPLGPFLNKYIDIDESDTTYESNSNQVYQLNTGLGVFIEILRSLRPISNWLFSNLWLVASLNFLGSGVIPQNLSYFVGLFTCLQIRFMTLDNRMSNCFQCQEGVPSRSYLYAWDSSEGLAYTSRLRNVYYSNDIILNLDWTLVWVTLLSILFLILKMIKKENNLMSQLIFGTLDGSIFEITLFSFEVINRHIQSQNVEIMYLFIASVLLLLVGVYSFKPLFYLKGEQEDEAKQEQPKQQRRGTSYPGKQIQLRQYPMFSGFYMILYEQTRGQLRAKRFKRSLIIAYFCESQLQVGLAIALIFLWDVSDYLIFGLSLISVQILTQMILIYDTYLFGINNSNMVILVAVFKTAEYVLLLCVFTVIYINGYLVGLTIDDLQVANSQHVSGQTPLYQTKFQQNIDSINQYGALCMNLLYPFLIIQLIKICLQSYVCNSGVQSKAKEPRTLDAPDKGQVAEFYMESAGAMKSSELLSPSSKPHIQRHGSDEQLNKKNDEQPEQPFITPTPMGPSNDNDIVIEMAEVKYTKMEDEPQNELFIQSDTFAVNEFNTKKKETQSGQKAMISNMNTNSHRTSGVVYDTQQMQVVMPKRDSLILSRLFGHGTIKINKGELAAIYNFENEIYIGDQLTKKEEFRMIKDFDDENMKLFTQDMRIVGIHTVQIKNINRAQRITISKLHSKIISENRISKREVYQQSSLLPGGNFEVKIPVSFDFFTDEQLDDRIEIKGSYEVESDPPSQRRIKIELCNSQMRMIKVLPYSQQQLGKLRKANKDEFVLVYEEKILKFNWKNADSYISHHKLLKTDLAQNMYAAFAKISIVLPSSPMVFVHMILEYETDGYLLISIFVKKTCRTLTPGCKSVLILYAVELLQFMREV